MQAFQHVSGRAVQLSGTNIDTDQVIPARFLRNPRASGYAGYLFHDLRYAHDGSPRPEFPLNLPANAGAPILAAGENFGCGSSREGAVYALFDAGFRCVVAPSFGDIFRNNCYKNGVLPIALDAAAIAGLFAQRAEWTVDLPAQTVRAGAATHAFAIEPFWKECLLEGVDDIDLTLRERDSIAAFAAAHFQRFPWLPLDMARWQANRP